jgi:hypothetical protein
VGIPLCPFAAPDHAAGRVRVAVSEARTRDEAIRDGLREAALLLETPRDEVATTVVAFPNGFGDYEGFLDVGWSLEEQLEDAGAEGELQVIAFHPEFRFAELDEADLAHYTNRSPVPLLHLLREDDVTRAVETHPDIDRVPAENSARLEALGADAVRERWRRL